MWLMTQDGLGAFNQAALIPLGDKPESIASGDVDGDGIADAIISLDESKRLMILRSLGNGQFANPSYVNLPTSPVRLQRRISIAMIHWIWQ